MSLTARELLAALETEEAANEGCQFRFVRTRGYLATVGATFSLSAWAMFSEPKIEAQECVSGDHGEKHRLMIARTLLHRIEDVLANAKVVAPA